MTSIFDKLLTNSKIHPPKFIQGSIQYETMMGSIAYGVSTDMSDVDIYGFCIPPKHDVFPHLRGEIPGFGSQLNRFDQFQEHHIEFNDRTYDINIYSIVKFFQLCMENNPNMIDSLYTPLNVVLTMTPIGAMVRGNRDLFLHKGIYHKMRGYAYSQLSKIENKQRTQGARKEVIEEYGYDVKFAYHVVRLLLEAEQALGTHTIDLQRDKELLKAVRAGEYPLEKIREFFTSNESFLEKLYYTSTLRHKPDEPKIKQLLLDCLEHHYGDLSNAVVIPDKHEQTLQEIYNLAAKGLGK